MSILADLTALLSPVCELETGNFSNKPPDEYIIITPMTDDFGYFADNQPQFDIQEARISLYSKENYIKTKNKIVKLLLNAGFTITDRKYIEFEDNTKYHHYAIDAANYYDL